jgi:hypothetical protein
MRVADRAGAHTYFHRIRARINQILHPSRGGNVTGDDRIREAFFG